MRGINLLIRNGAVGETYNIGGIEERANLDIVHRLCAAIDEMFVGDASLAQRFPNAPAASGGSTESLIMMVKDRPGHDWRYAVDAGRIHTEPGYDRAHSFETGLCSTFEWMLANEDWWRSILDDSYPNWIEDQCKKR